MHIRLCDERILVMDDFLSASQLETLWDEVQQLDYRSWKSEIWNKHYPADSGDLYEGPAALDVAADTACTAVQAFIVTLRASADKFENLCGRRGHDWQVLTVRPFVMPAGSCLSWHEDGGGKTGAFVFYAHPHWGARWGGELLVAQPPTPAAMATAREKQRDKQPYFETQILDALLDSPGLGSYITPRPNRLVILKGGTWHSIRRVEPAAGDHLRVTLAGFFCRLLA